MTVVVKKAPRRPPSKLHKLRQPRVVFIVFSVVFSVVLAVLLSGIVPAEVGTVPGKSGSVGAEEKDFTPVSALPRHLTPLHGGAEVEEPSSDGRLINDLKMIRRINEERSKRRRKIAETHKKTANGETLTTEQTLELLEFERLSSYEAGWQAAFEKMTLEDFVATQGRVLYSEYASSIPQCHSIARLTRHRDAVASGLPVEAPYPESYDGPNLHPKCYHPSLELGENCSNSYATSTADAVSARLCQFDKNFDGLRLSAQDIVSCNRETTSQCHSGTLDGALTYLMQSGTVTDFCFPYTRSLAPCSARCPHETRTKIESFCRASGPAEIKVEIFANGPVTAAVVVTDELLVYAGGVFRPSALARTLSVPEDADSTNKRIPLTMGVSVVGWGQMGNIEFWKVQFNFGEKWGENGYARIAADAKVLLDGAAFAAIVDPELAKQPIEVPVLE